MNIGLPKGKLLKKSENVIRGLLNVQIESGRLHYENKENTIHCYLLKLRDIPTLLHDGMFDVAVFNTEWMKESGYTPPQGVPLDWCDSRMSLLISSEANLADLKEKKTLHCVTIFPRIARDFFQTNKFQNITIKTVAGSTEAFVPMLYDCAIEVVRIGKTIRQNQLKEGTILFDSKVILAAKKDLLPEQTQIFNRIRELC